jgi:hypothetical protein
VSDLKKGDSVSWNTPQGKTKGKVSKKLTKSTSIQGHKVLANKNNPEYEVVSDSSGKKAAHKPKSLNKE